MKRRNKIILCFIYIAVLIFTLLMEYFNIYDQMARTAINISTLCVSVLSLAISVGIVKKEETRQTVEEEKSEPPFSKEAYLKKAAEWKFTKREVEIGLLIANGYSNQQIAEELFISEATVKKHATHIYEKARADGRKDFIGKI